MQTTEDSLKTSKMKRLATLVVIIVFAIPLFSQKWIKYIGEPNQIETSRRVVEHYDKGYLLSAQHNEHGWLVKTDINGNVEWDIELGTGTDQVITEKTVYNDLGDIFLFGTLHQDIEPFWPLAIKLNACGELQWCRQLYFNEYVDGSFYDAIILENGDLLAVANMPDEDQYDMIFLFCISPDGEYKWKQSYASKENYPDFEMRLGNRIQFFDDIYIISGYVYSPHPNYPTVTSIRPMFIGIDTLFNEKWVLEFGLEDNMKGKALETIQINDSLYMGVGRYRYIDSTGETQDAWAMIYNDKGEQTGYKIISADKLGSEITESVFYEIVRVNDSVYLASSGYFYGEEDDIAYGEIVFDTAGNVYNYSLRENTTGGNSSVIKTFDNKYTIACSYQYPDLSYDVYLYKVNDSLEQDTVYTGTYTYDSLCPGTIQSGVIDLTGCGVITNMEDIPWLEDYDVQKSKVKITPVPNPAKGGIIKFRIENNGLNSNMELKCFNVFGELMLRQKIEPSKHECSALVSNWPPGIYIAVLYTGDNASGYCKFIIE